jgi:hypothetical protein
MRRLALLAPLALLACATTAAEPPVGDRSSGMTCQGEQLARFSGRPASAELGAEMLRVSGAAKLRWVAKGMMVTMDYRDDRLTVWLTEDNRVERANCG